MALLDTRDRLLDAAEACFAERGFDASSLREITQAAGANLAAVNYHFSSKDGLIQAVLERRILPMNAARLALLDAAALTGDLDRVLEAFARPPLALATTASGPVVTRLMARVFADPHLHQRLATEHFAELRRRFLGALADCLPGVPPATLQWALQFLLGSLVHTLLGATVLERLSDGRCRLDAVEEVLQHFIRYHRAAMIALVGEPAS